MRRALLLLPLLLLVANAPPERGQEVFTRRCAPCHGAGPGNDGAAMLPGTAALAARHGKDLPAPLEQRGDLDEATLRMIVRNGIGAMPMFRKTELGDQDIAAIALWLQHRNRPSALNQEAPQGKRARPAPN